MSNAFMNVQNKPVVLCILDGWGLRQEKEHNAIAMAHTPHWDHWIKTYPMAALDASGLAVGLPKDQMGNSEVGHMTIGAGKAIWQDLPRITKAFQENQVASLPAFKNFVQTLQQSGGRCHLMGLLSPGGVHSHQDHLVALIQLLATSHIPVSVHLWLDGRDTSPKSAVDYMSTFMAAIKPYPQVQVATLGGRFYGMDRDQRWERIEKTYRAMVEGQGPSFDNPVAAIEQAYARGETDEFIVPAVAIGYQGMKTQDGLFVANFRADRVRQILSALVLPDFTEFTRPASLVGLPCLGLTAYADVLTPYMSVLFPSEDIHETLGSLVAAHGGRQYRIAETEKYAHITFFFNGGKEDPFPGEVRKLIPSPKVATYDLQPEMAASEVTDHLVHAIETGAYDLCVVNYANPDMVGHTGNMAASIKAIETVDACLGRVHDAILAQDGVLIITADHGNVECLYDATHAGPHTAHTTNLVPFLVVSRIAKKLKQEGTLADIAPTVLHLLNLKKPAAMTGHNLIVSEVI